MESIRKEERNHETWLANYQENSLRQYNRAWEYWSQYMGNKDEDWILQNKDIEDWSKHLVNFHRWLLKQPKKRGYGTLSDNTAKVLTHGIRGYLRHIGIAIGLTKVQRNEISVVESNPTLDYPFNLQVKEQLLRVADPIEEYIVSVGISFGLRVGDFKTITRGMIEPLLNGDIPIQLGKVMTKKVGIPAYPFIDRDAKLAIERLLKEMDAKGRTKPNSKMITLTNRQITDGLKKLFSKAGVATGEYTVRFHVLRKFLTDQLAKVCSEDKWKAFVGKTTRSPYVSSEGKESYKKVLDFTNVNHERIATSTEIQELRNEIAKLKKELSDVPKIIKQFIEEQVRPIKVKEVKES